MDERERLPPRNTESATRIIDPLPGLPCDLTSGGPCLVARPRPVRQQPFPASGVPRAADGWLNGNRRTVRGRQSSRVDRNLEWVTSRRARR